MSKNATDRKKFAIFSNHNGGEENMELSMSNVL